VCQGNDRLPELGINRGKIMRFLAQHVGVGLIVAALGLNVSTSPVSAKVIAFDFDAVLFSGPVAVAYFNGTGSYDDAGLTGIGDEFASLTKLDFTLGNVRVTRAFCTQGCQVELLNGIPFTFTAFLPLFEFGISPNALVSTIVFGFGAPGGIFYSTKDESLDPEFSGAGLFVMEPHKKSR
jgi:hypothetical protein